MQVPDRIHFFSYATGVSLELPVGFTEGDESATGVVYADHDDDAGRDRAVVLVTVLGPAEAGAEAVAVDALSRAAGDVIDRQTRDIDDETVAVAHLHCPDGLPGAPAGDGGADEDGGADGTRAKGGGGLLREDIAVAFAAVVFGGALVTITGVAPWAEAARYRAVFDEALDSCRFLAIEAAA